MAADSSAASAPAAATARSQVSWYAGKTREEFLNELSELLLLLCGEQLEALLAAPDATRHHSVRVSAVELLQASVEVGAALLAHAERLLPVGDEAVLEAQRRVLAAHGQAPHLVFKPNAHFRLHSLPVCPELTRPNVSSIRCSDVGRLISISGTVTRSGLIQMLDFDRQYECDRCGFAFHVRASIEQGGCLELPKVCPSRGVDDGAEGEDEEEAEGEEAEEEAAEAEDAAAPRGGWRGRSGGWRSRGRGRGFGRGGGARSTRKGPCKGTSFRYVEGSHVCRDFQELKVQEQVQKLSMGSIPRSILVIMQDDLVDLCKAGDDVTLTGVVRHMWQPLARDQRCELEVFIDTNSVLVSNDKKGAVVITRELREDFEGYWRAAAAHPLRARDLIVRSVCPQLYGLYLVKLCVALTLIGGVQRIEASGMRVRGESHLLIVGDPGTGKSQLLRYAARISPRSVLTTGIGTTSAGLTVTAVKDNGEWMLEAGALVLADGGLCCIDEFGCIRESDRATIHEAMEQQTLSVAKAGLVCSLNTRCTVFAVLNPKGPYDHKAELSVNTAIASPLLSRFDVVLLMLDTQNEAWDEKVASYILDNASGGGGSGSAVAASAAAAAADGDGDVDGDGGGGGDPSQRPAGVESKAAEAEAEVWPLERMQAYVQLVKSEFRPVMLPFSKRILISYYQIQRQKCERSAARTTIRLLESLVRLAQAHARLMFRPVVLPVDAITAVIAVESSTLVSSILGVSSALHAGFAEDPDALFAEQQEIVLQRLGLSSRDIPPDERSYNYAALCRLAAGTPSAWPRGSSVGPGAPASDSTRSEPSLGALADGALGLDGLPCRSTPERFAPQPLSEAPAFASPSSEQPLRRAAAASAAPRSSSPLHAGAAIGSGALAASLGTVARRQRGGLELWDSELSHALGSEQVLDSSLHAPSPKRRR